MRKDYLLPTVDITSSHEILVLDTEFSRLPFPSEAVWDWAGSCEVIAVGIVPLRDEWAHDLSFYAARLIDSALLGRCTAFVKSEVIPYLDAVPTEHRFRIASGLALQLNAYLERAQQRSLRPIALAVDWIGDAYLIGQLLEREPAWLLVDQMPSVADSYSRFFVGEFKRHNALHDALALRAGLLDHFAAQIERTDTGTQIAP